MEVPGKQYTATSDLCETCQIEGTTTEADGYCQQCKEYICNTCFQNHLRAKPCRDHVMVFSSEDKSKGRMAGREKLLCPKHANERRKYYCRQHDSVACGDCAVFNHRGCKMELIIELSNKFDESSEFQEVLKRIKSVKSMNEETDDLRKRYQSENTSIFEDCIKEIRNFRKEINEYLDRTEAEIVETTKKMSKGNNDLLVQIGKQVEEAKSSFDMLEELFNANIYANDILFINFAESKAVVEEVEKSARETRSRNTIQSFTFVPETRLQQLMQLKIRFGTIKKGNGENVEQFGTDEPSVNDKSRPRLVERETQTERKTTDAAIQTDNVAAPVYKDPDPRSRGFDVCKRVKGLIWNNYLCLNQTKLCGEGKTGTVTSVDPWGFMLYNLTMEGATRRSVLDIKDGTMWNLYNS